MGVSLRHFAHLDSCSEMLVRRSIAQGKLFAFDDGFIDPALAKTPWRKENISANTANSYGSDPAGALLSYPEAQRLKENNLARKESYQALLRKLVLPNGSENPHILVTISRLSPETRAASGRA